MFEAFLPGAAQLAKVFVCGCESWKRLEASDPPWLPQTASCGTNSKAHNQAVNTHTHTYRDDRNNTPVLRLPGCPEEAAVKRSKAGQSHKNGNHGCQSLESAVCERLQGHAATFQHTVHLFPVIHLLNTGNYGAALTTATASDSSSSAGVIMV